MTNLEFLACAEKGLPFKRQNSVDQYLVGILSVMLDEAAWARAVNHAIEMEARIHGASPAAATQGDLRCA